MTDAKVTQRLAAILVADVVGYSRLMQDDEGATVATLDTSRRVFQDHIVAHQGRVVDMAGDSVLAVFETAIGAANSDEEHNASLIAFYLTFGDVMSTEDLIACLERNAHNVNVA